MVVLNQSPQVNRWLSGQRLYWLLLTTLSAVVLLTDSISGRLSAPLTSLTLPFAITTLTVTLLGFWAVPVLRSLKAGQVIREDGPQSHLKKAGTPTMGGIFFVPVALAISLVWSTIALPSVPAEVVAAVLLTLSLALVGWADDWQVLRKKSNQGMSARLRLGIEFGSGALFGLWLMQQQAGITTLQFPFGVAVPIGILFLFLATFVVAAESNAVNLTDGMDGLAPGTSAIALLGMALVVAPNWPGLMIFCGCMAGGCLGFLAHNYNPARVFMGDTGSLALGGALAAVGLISNSLWALLILSGLFLIEALSVIAQVIYFKATKGPDGVGKRLLRMSPLHNHFELSGWPEVNVVFAFYSVVALLALVSLGLNTFAV
jgi:phospho-N-acetylmuramoyl-pentapeptide-transferase